MNAVKKQMVVAVVPVVLGMAAAAQGENIQWAQVDNSQPPAPPGQQVSAWPPTALAPPEEPKVPEVFVGGGLLIVDGMRE